MEVCLESRFDFAGLTAFTLVPLENVQLKIFHLVFILTILYYTLTNTNTTTCAFGEKFLDKRFTKDLKEA